jgi:hypothetical protein
LVNGVPLDNDATTSEGSIEAGTRKLVVASEESAPDPLEIGRVDIADKAKRGLTSSGTWRGRVVVEMSGLAVQEGCVNVTGTKK